MYVPALSPIDAEPSLRAYLEREFKAIQRGLVAARDFPESDEEVSAGVVVANPQYPPGVVNRYDSNTMPGTTDMSAAFAAAALVNEAGGPPITMLAELYSAAVSIRYDNAAIVGPGSSVCTIRHPAGALAPGGVIEVGDTASGNGAAAYDGFVAYGFTIDGNKANTTAPGDDLHGHGIILTKITNWRIADVIAVDCHNAGVNICINSNYGHLACTVEDCGNATHTAPGFDINSSKHLTGAVVSKDCYNGARVLDNCWGCVMDFTVLDAVVNGWVYDNQTVNESNNNIFRVTVRGGVTSNGCVIGPKCRNSQLHLSVEDVDGHGVQEIYTATAADQQNGNTYIVTTRKCGASSALIGGNGSNWTITSDEDGEAGGDPFAVIVEGQRNNIMLNVTTPATPQIRGIEYTANSADNLLVAFNHNTLVSDISDAGSNNLAAEYS